MRAETLILELMADTSQLTRDINAAIDNAAKKVKGLEDSVITVKAPLKYLQDLNKELDLKERHIKQVANVAKSTPIVIRADSRQVKIASQDLKLFTGQVSSARNQLNQLYSTAKDFTVKGIVTVEEKRTVTEKKTVANQDTTREVQSLGKEFSNEIKQGFKEIKGGNILSGLVGIATSPLRAIGRGFYEGIGITSAQRVATGAIRGIEKEWSFALNKIGEGTGNAIAKAGSLSADAMLRTVGTTSAELNSLFKDLETGFANIFDEDEARKRINNIADALNKTLVKAFQTGTFFNSELQELKNAINEYRNLRKENVTKARTETIGKTAQAAKSEAENLTVVGDVNKDKVVLYSGGFAGDAVSKKRDELNQQMLQRVYGDSADVLAVPNELSQGVTSKDNPVKWLVEATKKLVRLNMSGEVNPDVVKLVSTALAIREKNPHITIEFVGHSAGGFLAEEAVAVMKQLGDDNVKGVGIGTPKMLGELETGGAYQSVIGQNDVVKTLGNIGSVIGVTGSQSQGVAGVDGHSLGAYLVNETVNQIIGGNLVDISDLTEPNSQEINHGLQNLAREISKFVLLAIAKTTQETVRLGKEYVPPVANATGIVAMEVGRGLGEGGVEVAQMAIRERRLQKLDESVKMAQEMALSQSVEVGDKPIIFVAGGNAGTGGRAGIKAKKVLRDHLGREDYDIQPVETPNTDSSVSAKEDRLLFALDQIIKQANNNVFRGYNPDAVNLASKVIAARKIDPEANIQMIGHSAGGIVVEEAIAILNQLGITDVQGTGVGTPNSGIGYGVEQYQSMVGKEDKITKRLFSLKEAEVMLESYGGLADLKSHNLSSYLKHPDLVKRIAPDKLTPYFQKVLSNHMEDLLKLGQMGGNMSKDDPYSRQVRDNLGGIIANEIAQAKKLIKDLGVEDLQPLLKEYESMGELLADVFTGNYHELTGEWENIQATFNAIKKVIAEVTGEQEELFGTVTKAVVEDDQKVAGVEAFAQGDKITLSKEIAKNIASGNMTDFDYEALVHESRHILQRSLDPDDFLSPDFLRGKLPDSIIEYLEKRADISASIFNKKGTEDYAKSFAEEFDAFAFALIYSDSVKKAFEQTRSKSSNNIYFPPVASENNLSVATKPFFSPVVEPKNASNDIWDDNYELDSIVTPIAPKKGSQRSPQFDYIDPFAVEEKAKANVNSNLKDFSDLVNINTQILTELKSINSLLKPEVKNTPNQPTIPVHDGEFVTDITGGLSLRNQGGDLNLFQQSIKNTATLVRNAYDVMSGGERFTFDLVKKLTVGLVDLEAAKKVTQTVAPGFMLAAIGHDLPLIGAGLDAMSEGIVTPLLGHGMGAVGSGIAGLLPDTVVNGAMTAAGWLSRVPGVTALGSGLGAAGNAVVGGIGTGATYLLGGNLAKMGIGFGLNQATKPLGYLMPSQGQAGDKAYNLLTGISNYVVNANNQINRLMRQGNQVPLLPPRPVEYQTVEVLPPDNRQLPFVQTYPLLPSNPKMLGGSSIENVIDVESKLLQETLDIVRDTDSKEAIDNALRHAQNIAEGFKELYASIKDSLKAGRLKDARMRIEAMFEYTEKYTAEINQAIANLDHLGLNTNFGTSGFMAKIDNIKSQLSKRRPEGQWGKPLLKELQQKEANAYYLGQSQISSILAQKAISLIDSGVDTKEVEKRVQALFSVFNQLNDIDLNSLGRDVIKGLGKGIRDEEGNIDKLMIELAQSLPDEVRRILGIKSPSKVFMQIGEDTGKGFEIGAVNSLTDANNAIHQSINNLKKVLERDIEYLQAALKGDTAKAQQMVENAAKGAGYNVGPVYHGTNVDFTEFSTKYQKPGTVGAGTFFSDRRETAEQYGVNVKSAFLRGNKNTSFDFKGKQWNDIPGVELENGKWVADPFHEYSSTDSMAKDARRNGFDLVKFLNVIDSNGGDEIPSNVYSVFHPNQIKSADRLTKTDKGVPVPLSARFDDSVADIRGNVKDLLAGIRKAAGKELAPILSELEKTFENIGENSVESMIAAIQGTLGKLYQTGEKIGEVTEEGTKKALEMNSPSKVFMQIGKDVVVGYQLGIDGTIKSIELLDLPVPELKKQDWTDLADYKEELGRAYDVIEQLTKTIYSKNAEGIPVELDSINRNYFYKGSFDEIQSKIAEDTARMTPEASPETVVNKAIQSSNSFFESIRKNFPIVDVAVEKLTQFKNLIVNIGLAGAGAIGLFVIGKALTNIAVDSVKVYRNFESIFIASKTIANGSEFLGKVRNQVKALGGDLETAMRQGQQFVTGLHGTTLERKAEDLFLGADQALKSLGLQTQQYDSAILAIKQVASKGRVSLEEISGQLGEAVPGALNIAAQAMQTNVQGFIQLVESGNLLSEEFLPKFVERLKAQTAFLQPEVEKSLNASIGRLGANTTDLQVNIGASLSPMVVPTVNLLSKGLDTLNKNFDKAVIAAEMLAVALALPAAKMGLELAVNGVRALLPNLIVAKTAADALSQSLMIAKGLATGSIYLAGTAVIVGAIDLAMTTWKRGSSEVRDITEQIDSRLKSIAERYKKINDEAKKSGRSSSWFGAFTDDAFIGRINDVIQRMNNAQSLANKLNNADPNKGMIPLFPTWGDLEQQWKEEDIQKALGSLSKGLTLAVNLSDGDKIENYISQVTELQDKIAINRARITNLRAIDPVGNAKQIKDLENSVYATKGLIDQLEKINYDFIPGGEAGLEGQVKEAESLRDVLIELKKRGFDFGNALLEVDKYIAQGTKNLEKMRDINNQLASSVNNQRLAWIDLNAQLAKAEETLQFNQINNKLPIIQQQIDGRLGSTLAAYKMAQVEVKNQQANIDKLLQDQKARENFLKNKLETNAKTTVFELIGKSLDKINQGDIRKINDILGSNQRIPQAISEQIVGTLQEYQNTKLSIRQAQESLLNAKLGVIQQARTVEDFNRNLSYSIRDFNRGIESKNSEIRGIYRDWQRTLDDTVYDNQLTVRRLGEAYQDLMFNMESQLETSRNELLNLTDQINSEKRKQASLSITPGIDSYAKQLDGIFSQLFDSLTNGESEKRQANLEAIQTQKQYIDSLRQIRDIQEQEYQARKDQIRKIEDLSGQLKSITLQLKDWFVQEFQKRDDFIRTNKREGYDVTKQLAPAPNFANNQRSQSGTVQPMIIYQNGQTVRNLPAQNPVNNVVPFLSNSRPTIQSQAPVKPVDLGNIDSTNNDWQSYYWQQKIKKQLPPAPKVNQAIASNVNNQLQQRAKELQSLAKPSVIPTVSASIPKKVQFGRASISHEELIALQQTAMRLGMPLATLLTIMLFETKGTLNPSIQNSKGATGLIQFMPATARRLGTTVNALKKMSFQEQLPYVEKYFKLHGWQAGMSDLEAYATVLGGNPRNINSKDSNGTNALSGMQRMNRQHRPIADNIMQHFGILSASPAFNFGIPESLEVGKTAGLLDDLGGFVSDKLNQFGNWKVNHRWMGKPKKQWNLYELMRDYVTGENNNITVNIEGEVKDLHKQTSSMTRGFVNYLKLQVKQGQIDAKTVDAYIKQYEGLNKEVTQKIDKAKPKAQPKINRPLKAAEYLNVFFQAYGLDWNLINEGMVDALAKGQVGKKFKMPKGFPLQQQHFENYLKLPETEQARLLLEAQAKRRGKIDDPILVRERTAKTSPTATAPIIKPNEFGINNAKIIFDQSAVEELFENIYEVEMADIVIPPFTTAVKESISDDVKQSIGEPMKAIASSITAQNFTPEKIVEFNPNLPKVPKLQEIPLSDYGALKERADAQKSVNESITNQKLILAQTKQDTAYLQTINDLQKMIYSLQDANRNKLRGAYDMRLEIASMVSNAKGYLTAAEQNFKVGSDMFRQIEDKRRQLADMRLDESRKQADWDKEKAILVERIESNDQLTLDQKQQAIQRIANLDTLIKESKELQKHHDIQLDILNADNNRMIQLARIKDAEIQRNNAIKEYADITASLATARYNLGGELINNGTVISAKMNALVNAYEFKEKLKTLNLSTAQMDEMVKMQKELSDINIAQSYVDAIPFLKEFSTGLKDAILQTTTWNDALKKLLDLVAGTILDQMVIKPIQLGIANILNDWGIFGNTEPINPPALDTNSGFSQAPFNEFGAVDYSGIVSGSQALAQSIQSVNTVIPDLGTAFVEQTLTTTQNTITEQTALMTFVSALTQASAAVLGFSASLGGKMFGAFNPVSEGLLSGFTGDTLMLPTFANGVDNAMKKERNLSGKSPFLAVLHEGEAVLSTLNGDAQLWRALKANGDWNHLKADNPKNFAFGSEVKPVRTTTVKSGDNVQISMVVNASNADSFRKSERRILSDMEAQIKRNRR